MKSIVTNPWARDFIARHVLEERWKQDQKWGEQNHANGTGEPFSDVLANNARTACEIAFERKRGTWFHILSEEVYEAFAESDPVKLRAELVQVAAVAMAWIECIDRGGNSIANQVRKLQLEQDRIDEVIRTPRWMIEDISRSTSPVASGAQSEEQPRQGSEGDGTPKTSGLSVASTGDRQQDVTGCPRVRIRWPDNY